MRLLLLSFLLAKGMMPSCSDDVNLGDDVDANVGGSDAGADAAADDAGSIVCAESDCGPVPPGLPCGDINAGLICEASAGLCQWTDYCPADGDECSPGSCEESVRPTCGPGDDAAPPARCMANERECAWEAPACDCAPEDCGPLPPTLPCVDGSGPSQTCERDDTDRCNWTNHCPAEGEECAEEACGPLPPTLPCSQMMSMEQTGRCVVEAGACAWEYVECGCEDSFCGERGLAPNCGDTAMPASPGPCERNADAVCEWSWLCS